MKAQRSLEFRQLARLPAKLLLACALLAPLAAKPGDHDDSFDPGTGPAGTVAAVAIDSAGKLVVGGSFKSFNGTQAGSLVRLLTDGKIDPSFKAGEGAEGEVKAIEILGDGRILVAGRFTRFNGKKAVGIVMLASDGSVVPVFESQFTEKEMSAGLTCIESFPGGRVAVGGYFATCGGKPARRVAFLDSSGKLDPARSQGEADSHVMDIDLLPDGGALVSGFFNSFGGHPTACVARLKADGSIDKTFLTAAPKGSVAYSVAATADGKVIAGGYFKTADGGKRHLARLTSAGSLDQTFAGNDAFDSGVSGITVDPLGRVLVAGDFKKHRGTPSSGLARLKPDGNLDGDFAFDRAISPNFIQEYPIDREGRIIAYGWRELGRKAGPPWLCRVLGGP